MSKFLTPQELCERLNVKKATLQSWRVRGGGPKYVKVGHRTIVYPLADVELWERLRTFNNTAEEKQKEPV